MKTSAKIVGLTGGIGSGKSTASNIFMDFGFKVICADQIAHDVVRKGRPAYKEVLNTFGKDVLLPNKELNREALANIVFKSPRKKKQLESIIHPKVRQTIKSEIKRLSTKSKIPIILDVPLLFESGLWEYCDAVVCVYVNQKTQLKRLSKRGLSYRKALARIRNQMPLREKAKRADFVLNNGGTISALKKKIQILIKSPDWNEI